MARYENSIGVAIDAGAFAKPVADYLTNEGFKQVDYKGESVWKKGVGLLTAPQYISVKCEGRAIKIQAFIKFALLPGVYIGEMGTAGFFGGIPKAALKARVITIEQYIEGLAAGRAE